MPRCYRADWLAFFIAIGLLVLRPTSAWQGRAQVSFLIGTVSPSPEEWTVDEVFAFTNGRWARCWPERGGDVGRTPGVVPATLAQIPPAWVAPFTAFPLTWTFRDGGDRRAQMRATAPVWLGRNSNPSGVGVRLAGDWPGSAGGLAVSGTSSPSITFMKSAMSLDKYDAELVAEPLREFRRLTLSRVQTALRTWKPREGQDPAERPLTLSQERLLGDPTSTVFMQESERPVQGSRIYKMHVDVRHGLAATPETCHTWVEIDGWMSRDAGGTFRLKGEPAITIIPGCDYLGMWTEPVAVIDIGGRLSWFMRNVYEDGEDFFIGEFVNDEMTDVTSSCPAPDPGAR